MRVNNLKKIMLLFLWAWAVSGCGAQNAAAPTQSNDLLPHITARGTLVIATDAAYPPQSQLVADAKRAENTKCGANEYTAQEFTGFDIAAAVEIAKRLNVEACFVSPTWSQIIGGNWDGRWDISVGSMAITPERLGVLYFAQPYYATPAALFVHQDNVTFSQPEDLSGKRIGVCAGCTYEEYLKGTLSSPGVGIEFVINNAEIAGYDVDTPALEALSLGDGAVLDGVLTAQPTGLEAIRAGAPIKQLGEPLFFEYLAMAIDKKNNYDPLNFAIKISEIVKQMHADGTLAKLSLEYYGMDYTAIAAEFNLSALNQLP